MKANNSAAIYGMSYGERIFRRGELSIVISEHLNDPNNSRLKKFAEMSQKFRFGEDFFKKPRKASKFMDRPLYYFCTVL